MTEVYYSYIIFCNGCLLQNWNYRCRLTKYVRKEIFMVPDSIYKTSAYIINLVKRKRARNESLRSVSKYNCSKSSKRLSIRNRLSFKFKYPHSFKTEQVREQFDGKIFLMPAVHKLCGAASISPEFWMVSTGYNLHRLQFFTSR